ncbi:hypothetical protein LguiB_021515 [Lonicera macranthoides]
MRETDVQGYLCMTDRRSTLTRSFPCGLSSFNVSSVASFWDKSVVIICTTGRVRMKDKSFSNTNSSKRPHLDENVR